MKTILRVSVFGLFAAAFMAVSAVSGFAQNPCDDALEVKQVNYTKFREGRKEPRTIEKAKTGIQAGEEFVAKYGACEVDKAVVEFINKNIPELKEWIENKNLFDSFNNAIRTPASVNPSAAFTGGKQIIAKKPETSLDISLVLASIGFDNAVKTPPVSTYDAEALSYAKSAIQLIESGKTSTSWGYFNYNYAILDAQKKVDPIKSKANALAYMNFTVGTIMYYGQKQQKDALPYFYKAAQSTADTRNKPGIYQAIGAWYIEEIVKLNADRDAKLTANGNKENEETLAVLAQMKGYADRAIDAYARAYKLAPTTDAEYRKELYTRLQGLYKLRFDKADGMDPYIASITSRPMPDPSTTVEPIKDEKPATTTTSTSSSTTTNPSTTTTTPTSTTTTKPSTTTKPASDTTTKPATDTKPANTTKPVTSKTSPTKTTKAKTTATKKKSSR